MSASRFLSNVLKPLGGEVAAHRHLVDIKDAFAETVNFHAPGSEPLKQVPAVLLVTPETVLSFDDEHLKLAGFGVGLQCSEAGTIALGCCRPRLIVIVFVDGEVFLTRVIINVGPLIGDRADLLFVRREPLVSCCQSLLRRHGGPPARIPGWPALVPVALPIPAIASSGWGDPGGADQLG